MCALWHWPWRYDLGSRSWHTLESWTAIMWNIIQIQLGNEELWPGHGFWVCVPCDLDLGYMTLALGQNIPLTHGQQFCEILSRSNMAVRSYGPDTEFWVCVHCDHDDMTLGQVHDTPLGHGQQLCQILFLATLAVVFTYFWYCFSHLTCLCYNFYGLSALVGCWSSAFISRIIYKFLNVCPFDYTAFAINGKVGIP